MSSGWGGRKSASTAQLDQRDLSASYLSLKYLHAGFNARSNIFLSSIDKEPVKQATVLSKRPA